jgi:hypothetical protein
MACTACWLRLVLMNSYVERACSTLRCADISTALWRYPDARSWEFHPLHGLDVVRGALGVACARAGVDAD